MEVRTLGNLSVSPLKRSDAKAQHSGCHTHASAFLNLGNERKYVRGGLFSFCTCP